MAWVILMLGTVILPSPGRAADTSAGNGFLRRVHLGTALTFSRFEQQVKAEIGGVRGQRLVTDTALGVDAVVLADIWGPLSGGLFARLDLGERTAGRFAGLDAEGKAVVSDQVGGAFTELWLGPLVRARYRWFFLDLGYGLMGIRSDGARDDLPSTTGDRDGALRTSTTVAWRVSLGGEVPLAPSWRLTLSLQYRVRYYDSRGGDPLAESLVHGTQDFAPFIGIEWRPGYNSR